MARPIAIAIDPGYDGGVAELWSDGTVFVVHLHTPDMKSAVQRRSRLGRCIANTWARDSRLGRDDEWQRCIMEWGSHKRKDRSMKAVQGLAMTVGCWHTMPIRVGGFEHVAPNTWMCTGWEIECRALEQEFGFEIPRLHQERPKDDALAALGILLWARRNALRVDPIRIPIRRVLAVKKTA